MKPILQLDIDGPIADWKQSFLDKLNLLKGTNYTMADTGSAWSIEEDLKLDPQTAKIVYAQMDGPGVAISLPETHLAVSSILTLMEHYDIYFLTAHCRESVDWVHGRRAWLTERFGVEQADKIVYTHHKYLVYGDYYVDDRLDHLIEWKAFWARRGLHPCPILYTCGRDTPSNLPRGIYSARSWSDLQPMLRMNTYPRV